MPSVERLVRKDAGVIRWGVVGPGAIATGFADAMQSTDGGTIVAVASRSGERADAFADRYSIPARYGDDESLAADPDVDAVYVATPHSRHESDTLRFLRAGKNTSCARSPSRSIRGRRPR